MSIFSRSDVDEFDFSGGYVSFTVTDKERQYDENRRRARNIVASNGYGIVCSGTEVMTRYNRPVYGWTWGSTDAVFGWDADIGIYVRHPQGMTPLSKLGVVSHSLQHNVWYAILDKPVMEYLTEYEYLSMAEGVFWDAYDVITDLKLTAGQNGTHRSATISPFKDIDKWGIHQASSYGVNIEHLNLIHQLIVSREMEFLENKRHINYSFRHVVPHVYLAKAIVMDPSRLFEMVVSTFAYVMCKSGNHMIFGELFMETIRFILSYEFNGDTPEERERYVESLNNKLYL